MREIRFLSNRPASNVGGLGLADHGGANTFVREIAIGGVGSGSGTGLSLLNSGSALPAERVDRRDVIMLESMEMSVLVCCCVLARSIGAEPAFQQNLALRMSYLTHELKK